MCLCVRERTFPESYVPDYQDASTVYATCVNIA